MPIPDLLKLAKIPEPRELELYRQVPMPPEGWPDRTTPEALKASDDKAHDNFKLVRADRDRLQRQVIDLYVRLWFLVKLFLGTMVFTWSVLGWALHLLIPYAVRGMAK